MSSEALNDDEIDCSKKGDCVELKEVVVRAKSNTNAFFGYNFGSSNLQNNSSTLHRAIYRTPATKDIDNGINEVVKMANPAFGAVLIADDLSKGKEVDKLEYLAVIPAFRIFKVTKYGTIIQKTIPIVNNRILEGFAKHAFAKGRHSDLGLSIEKMVSKGGELIKNNAHLLKEGDNTLIGSVNGIQKSFKAFVKDGQIMSINMYPGTSNSNPRVNN